MAQLTRHWRSWGDGAGAISVSLHMLHNRGKPEGLFRAAFMQSGAPLPVGNATDGQKYYDFVVKNTGCADSQDTLACLRTVPYDKLKAAIFETPGALSYQVKFYCVVVTFLCPRAMTSCLVP